MKTAPLTTRERSALASVLLAIRALRRTAVAINTAKFWIHAADHFDDAWLALQDLRAASPALIRMLERLSADAIRRADDLSGGQIWNEAA